MCIITFLKGLVAVLILPAILWYVRIYAGLCMGIESSGDDKAQGRV